jgi:hypothetical protein
MENNELTFIAVLADDGIEVLFKNPEGLTEWSEYFVSMDDVKSAFSDAIANNKFIDATI